MNFRKKLESMTGKEVLAAMIKGLENPVGEVKMISFGGVAFDSLTCEAICYGCAATNAICQIANVKEEYFKERSSLSYGFDLTSIDSDFNTLSWFEDAVDALRRGALGSYNTSVEIAGLPNLVLRNAHKLLLPALRDDDYKENLIFYKEYYESI